MEKNHPVFLWIFIAGWMLFLSACAPQKAAMQPTSPSATDTPSETFDDPFTYCAAVGSIDAPDARYAGEAVPDVIIEGFKKVAGVEGSTEPMEQFKKSTIWRCMGGKLMACNFGANLPCDSKANIDQTPSQAMQDYCAENTNSEFIPMSVTGHDTIYSWQCVEGSPKLLDQVAEVDAAGYLANIWYEITPAP